MKKVLSTHSVLKKKKLRLIELRRFEEQSSPRALHTSLRRRHPLLLKEEKSIMSMYVYSCGVKCAELSIQISGGSSNLEPDRAEKTAVKRVKSEMEVVVLTRSVISTFNGPIAA